MVAVLMYHRIAAESAATTYERSEADFINDLKYLKNNNISVISINRLYEFLDEGRIPSGKYAVITFDDGDRSWHDKAVPLLAMYGFNAVFFLISSQIDTETFISWDEAATMAKYRDHTGGVLFTLGSHTVNHLNLAQKKNDFSNAVDYRAFLDYETGESKRIIEDKTGATVDILSLPFGDGAGNAEIIESAVRNGYRMIRTSEIMAVSIPGTDSFRIPSFPVLNTSSKADFDLWFGL